MMSFLLRGVLVAPSVAEIRAISRGSKQELPENFVIAHSVTLWAWPLISLFAAPAASRRHS
jgi:hypothetical protein